MRMAGLNAGGSQTDGALAVIVETKSSGDGELDHNQT
jgi:hypothetical protein